MALSDLRAIVSFHDLKKKRGNGGGLSDGGLFAVRESLSTQGVLFGPPPGKAWEFLPQADEAELGFYVFNFDTVTAANFEVYFVLEDGTEFLGMPAAGGATPLVPAGTVEPFEFSFLLAHPMKLRVKLLESHPKRVLFAALATEFDLPKE
jgi:hypothetical protein